MKKHHRTHEVFDYICCYTVTYGYPPTLREIAEVTGFTSNSAVIRHLDKLEKWGWISRLEGVARGIHILRACDCPTDDTDLQVRLDVRRQQ